MLVWSEQAVMWASRTERGVIEEAPSKYDVSMLSHKTGLSVREQMALREALRSTDGGLRVGGEDGTTTELGGGGGLSEGGGDGTRGRGGGGGGAWTGRRPVEVLFLGTQRAEEGEKRRKKWKMANRKRGPIVIVVGVEW